MTLKPSADANFDLLWTKSSYSSNEGANCVEICAAPDTVCVRDSKDPGGPKLAFDVDSWSAFTGFVSR
jgi:hypothetical protein